MCLRLVYGVYEGTSTEVITRPKVFMIFGEEKLLYPVFMYDLYKEALPVGVWLDEKDYRPACFYDKVESYSGELYPLGWNVYVDEERANRVASIHAYDPDFSYLEGRIVLNVECKGLLANGEDVHGFVNEVYRYIKIEKES